MTPHTTLRPEVQSQGVRIDGPAMPEPWTVTTEGVSVPPNQYSCAVLFCYEEDGRISAIPERYPGAPSFGDTLQEAQANVIEALSLLIETCRDLGQEVRWNDEDDAYVPDPRDFVRCERRWVTFTL